MRFKMENPKKIDNILEGSYDDLSGLYGPYLDTLKQKGVITEVEDSVFKANLTDSTYEELY